MNPAFSPSLAQRFNRPIREFPMCFVIWEHVASRLIRERVAVYVGRERLQILRVPNDEVEYQIYRLPHPTTTCNPVWGFKGKGDTEITDRLRSNDY